MADSGKAYAFRKGARHLEIKIEKKYLLLSINGQAAKKRLCFYEDANVSGTGARALLAVGTGL